jgi:hypothetical protein
MSGWFSGSMRRRNSSVLSSITRASSCRPSAEYVAARLPIALPRAQQSVSLHLNQKTAKSRRTYQRMVLRQHAPLKLKRLLSRHKSIFVPPKVRVREGEIAHCGA